MGGHTRAPVPGQVAQCRASDPVPRGEGQRSVAAYHGRGRKSSLAIASVRADELGAMGGTITRTWPVACGTEGIHFYHEQGLAHCATVQGGHCQHDHSEF